MGNDNGHSKFLKPLLPAEYSNYFGRLILPQFERREVLSGRHQHRACDELWRVRRHVGGP